MYLSVILVSVLTDATKYRIRVGISMLLIEYTVTPIYGIFVVTEIS